MTDETKATRTCVCGNPAPAEGACPQCGAEASLQTSAKPAPVPQGPLATVPVTHGSESYAEMQARVEREGKMRGPNAQDVIDKTVADVKALQAARAAESNKVIL